MRVGQFVIDVRPLRTSRDFRLVFSGRLISLVGTGLTTVGTSVQVFHLTNSSLQVGLVNLTQGVPLLIGLLTGGLLADRLDRRSVVVVCRMAMGVTVAGLAVNELTAHPRLWVIYVLVGLGGAANGLGAPSLMAATPALVAPGQLASAGALYSVASQCGQVIGPALGGVIIAGSGLALCYFLDAASYLIMAVLLMFIRPIPHSDQPVRRGLRPLFEGFDHVRRDRTLTGLLLIDLAAVVFGMPNALFPALAAEHFHGGAATVGLLYTAPAVGAFIGALSSGWTSHIHRSGRALIVTVLVWGIAITAFGLSGTITVALLFLALAGAGDTVSEILRRALLQHVTPDRLQGRVSSLWLAQTSFSGPLGNAEAGLVARLFDPVVAVVSGGLLCVAGAVIVATTHPALRRASLHAPPVEPEASSPG